MKRILDLDKRSRLLLAAVGLGALALLAIALHDFDLAPAEPLWRQGVAPVASPLGGLLQGYAAIPAWKQFSFWLLLAILVALLASLLSPELRKRFIRSLLTFIATMWVLSYLLENRLLPWVNLQESAAGPLLDDSQALENIPPAPVFSPPDIPPWQSFLISLGLALALLLLTWGLLRWWRRIRDLRASLRPLNDLAAAARSSLAALAAGQEAGDVILRCYARMSETVEEKRGLVRQQAMTPAEFARRLEQAGLPGDPVQRLTRLFEAVRYGARKSGQDEINEATSCLADILRYCAPNGEPGETA
ncbi:MAG: DUF4129 domain-containing protein [Chloroflexota bacterium]